MQHFLTNTGYGGKCRPELSPVIAAEQLVPASDTVLIAADGAIKIVPRGTAYAGYSDVESAEYAPGREPDGKGGWKAPEPPPAPDAKSASKWELATVLATKGITFAPADPAISARWQYEPSFAIDGVVAKALATSLGYTEAQLQDLFNEAAALK